MVINRNRHLILANLTALAISTACATAQFKPDFKLKPDDFTVLMAVDAKLSTGLHDWRGGGHGKFFVDGWSDAQQSAAWTITADEAANYEVFILVKRENNQPLMFNLAAAGQALSGNLPANPHRWQRVKLDSLLALPVGASTVTLNIAPTDATTGFQAQIHAVELVRPNVHTGITQRALAMRSDPSWFQQARYGMMVHWTKKSVPLHGEPTSYEQAVANFDVETFADTMKSTGAGFLVFTTSHAMQFFPAPLVSLDKILPGRTTQRDLPADLAAALNKRGMKLFLYFHLGSMEDPEWLTASGFWKTDTSGSFGNWRAMISEVGVRYQEQLAGWWFDDGATSYYYRNAPWESLAKAAKVGNPQRMISFNAWELNNPTQFHDYCTGEGCEEPRGMDGLLTQESNGRYPSGSHAGLQATACLITESTWVHDRLNTALSKPKWNADQLTHLLRNFIAHKNVPIFNLEITQDGHLSPDSIATFKEVAARLH